MELELTVHVSDSRFGLRSAVRRGARRSSRSSSRRQPAGADGNMETAGARAACGFRSRRGTEVAEGVAEERDAHVDPAMGSCQRPQASR